MPSLSAADCRFSRRFAKAVGAVLLAAFLFSSLGLSAQSTSYTNHPGHVVDAHTGKPLAGVKVSHAVGGVSDAQGRFTVRYYADESDLRVVVSHPGYYTDTFSFAPGFVSLRRQPMDSMQLGRPKVAVVLSGGGAKGVAHIEALRAIEEAGIPVDMVFGTSMGSLIGALYCIGYSTDFLDSLVRHQDWTTLLSDRTDPSTLGLSQRREQNTYAFIRGMSKERTQQGGLIRGRNLMRLFRQLCDGYLDSIGFDYLPIPFVCVATDLVTNNEVDFRSGYLVQAMRASMAIPGVFTPVRMGDSVLVDGGLRNNFPTDLARKMGADYIIGVTVQGDPLGADDITGAATVLSQIIDLNTKDKYEENAALCDVMMKVDVSGYSAGSFTPSAIDTLLRRGAVEAARHRDELQALSQRIGVKVEPRSQRRQMPMPLAERQPRVTRAGSIVTNPIASVGFRFDTEEMGALQLNLKGPLPIGIPIGASATLRLGRQLRAALDLSFFPRAFTSPTVGYSFSRQELDIYSLGLRTYNVKYRQHTADVSPFNFRFRNVIFRAGIRWDLFDYFGRLLTADSQAVDLVDEHFFAYHAAADLNTENHWYFPTEGVRLHAAYAFRTDNFATLDGGTGLSDISFHWRINASPWPRFTVQPMVFGRLLLGSDRVPASYLNALGSEWFGHFVDQQMPFAGIGNIEYVDRCFAAAQLQLHYRVLDNHYLVLRGAFGMQASRLTDMPSADPILGLQLGYSYVTILGPIDLRLGYSNRTSKPVFLINIGHLF